MNRLFSPLTPLFSPLTGKLILMVMVAVGIMILWGYGEIQVLSRNLTEDQQVLYGLASQRLLCVGGLTLVVLTVLIQRLVQQSIRPLEGKTRASLEQQRQLINDLSHELRSPLSMIYSYLQSCQKHDRALPPSRREALEMAVADAERMMRLLEGWLNLARSDQQTIAPLNLNEVLIETGQMTEKFAQRTVMVEVPHRSIEILADRSRLMQVLGHLLDNAVYYSSEPVSVTLRVVGKWALVEILDRGCGIPGQDIDRIFDPFYRVDASRSRATGGFGLGLPFVKHSIEALGGSIEVESQVGVGSRFLVKLPLLGVRK